MSIIDRLFPASELEALRASPYDLTLYPGSISAKRRKLSSSRHTSGSDSGYSSDESGPISSSSRKRSRSSFSSSNGSISSSNCNTTPPSSQPTTPGGSFTQSALFRKYLSSLHPSERAKYRIRTQSDPTHLLPPNVLKAFYQHITLARSRSLSVSSPQQASSSSSPFSPHSPSAEPEDSAPSILPAPYSGWTAGPKSATSAHLSARIFDGIRLTSHERMMLNDLIPGSYVPCAARTEWPVDVDAASTVGTGVAECTYQQRSETQPEVPVAGGSGFAGFAIAINDDDDDEEQGLDGGFAALKEFLGNSEADSQAALEYQEGTGKVEDFFDLEEACDDSPSASC